MNDRRTESQPLVHDGVMSLNQSARIVQALDATTGDLLWSHERKLPPKLPTLAYDNRNIAILGTTIYPGTSDAFLVAVDAKTERRDGNGRSAITRSATISHRGRSSGAAWW